MVDTISKMVVTCPGRGWMYVENDTLSIYKYVKQMQNDLLLKVGGRDNVYVKTFPTCICTYIHKCIYR